MAKKPKGLSIKRNGDNLVCSWNHGESGYEKQEFRYATKQVGKKYGGWIYYNIKKAAKSCTIKWNAGVGLDAFKFEVRGYKKKKWSSWTSAKEYNVKAPNKATVSCTFNNEYSDPRVVFSWNVTADSSKPEWFYRVGWRTRLKNNNSTSNGGWSNVVFNLSKSGSYTQQESSSTINASGASYTREFQLIVYGPGGTTPSTGWSNEKNVFKASYNYGKPNTPQGVISTLTETETGGYLCEATWDSKQNGAHPIDSQELQYLITVPTVKENDEMKVTTDTKPIINATKDEKVVSIKHYYTLSQNNYRLVENPGSNANPKTSGWYEGRLYFIYNQNDTYTPVTTIASDVNPQDQGWYIGDDELYLDVPPGQLSWQVAGKFYPKLNNASFQNTKVQNKSSYGKKKVQKKKKTRLKKTAYKTVNDGKKITIKRDESTVERLIFPIDQMLNKDEVVFVRAVSKRGPDSNNTPSRRDLSDDLNDIYELSAPSGVVPTLSPVENNRIHVEANNECGIEGSFLIVSYKAKDSDEIEDIGIIESKDKGSKTIEIPKSASTYSIGVRAAIGLIPSPVRDEEEEYETYAFSDQINVFIESKTIWVEGTTVPSPPTNVILSHTDIGNIHVNWDWDWKEAQSAELSWSDYKDAWVSTTEPSYYSIENLYNGEWNISDLEVGKMYYVRVRLKRIQGDSELVSRWSDTVGIFLSSAPSTPRIELSPTYINPGQPFTATWTYVSTDNTAQKNARVFLYDPTTGETIGTELASVESSQSVKIETSEFGWLAGERKHIVVKVMSESDVESEWSPSAELNIVAPITCSVTYSSEEEGGLVSLSTTEEVLDDETQQTSEETITFDGVLRSLPLTLNITGAGESGITNVVIRRAEAFDQPGPDENEFNGYEGEIIYSASYSGETPLVIGRPGEDKSFSGSLDEGGKYTVVATVEDEYGQTATNSDVDFIVDWNHDAVMPYTNLEYVTNTDGEVGAKLTFEPLNGVVEGDAIDIYRMSVDKPELILRGAKFNTSYVDPYPTIGDFGGYRIVYRTKYDDFIMSDGAPAWWDITESNEESNFEPYNVPYSIISFDNYEIHLEYDVNLSSSWDKNFTETKYLGGSIQGDWSAGVSRTGSISTNVVTDNPELIRSMRRLAVYNGPCQIRSYDGSNYKANVNVSENIDNKQLWNSNGKVVRIVSYSLNITRVDGDSEDMLTYDRWITGE